MGKLVNNALIFLSIVMPLKLRIYIFFLYKHRYPVSFSSPTTWSEKIQCRKLTLGVSDSILADKFEVRKYVEDKVGSHILIPLLGVYDQLTEDDLQSLPCDAVIKTTHGSGAQHIHFLSKGCDFDAVISKFRAALNDSYRGSFFGETHYDMIHRRVIAEKKLDFGGDSPPDFKFHVFKNKETTTWILQVDFDRFTDHKRNYYDTELNLLDLKVIYENGSFDLPEANVIVKMADIAIKLNDTNCYSRVDLYLHEGQIFFGEITLTPGSGFERFSNKSYDVALGKLWQ
ncbi:ATP-grasp fold amidoligase family protein [Agarivorans sp. QJM3NY_33]|uniref:ATP-grasp fold amidoligase family protein n=1 Tax=Agarivorans sp. QJM3NY_33 TaxID=3421432 RepID=UPI003D7D76F9